MSLTKNTHGERLAYREWEMSIWTHLKRTGPQTTEALYNRLMADLSEEVSMMEFSKRLSNLRAKGAIDNSTGSRCARWAAVRSFDAVAYLYDSELGRLATRRETIYNWLALHGPSELKDIRIAVGDLTINGLRSALDYMLRHDMLTCKVAVRIRIYSANPAFDMPAYMARLPKAPQPGQPAELEPTTDGLRLEAYVPDPEPDTAPAEYAWTYCPPGKATAPTFRPMSTDWKPPVMTCARADVPVHGKDMPPSLVGGVRVQHRPGHYVAALSSGRNE